MGRFLAWVVGWYGKTLDWFLNYSWIAAIVYVACLAGVFVFFKLLPFTLLPTGDSGFIRGVFIAQEGSSPEQMHHYQDQVNAIAQEGSGGGAILSPSRDCRDARRVRRAWRSYFLKDLKQRPAMDTVVANLQKELATIPGIVGIMNPVAGAPDQHRRDQPDTRPLRLHAERDQSGRGVRRRREAAGQNAPATKGFSTVRSDYYNHTPNLDINIDRARASLYGVGAAKIEALLRAAYSENYVYLIKEPDNQYQVILEADDAARAHPEDPSELYVKADDNRTLVPMRAVTTSKETLGIAGGEPF